MARIGSMNISNKFLIIVGVAFVSLIIIAAAVSKLGGGEEGPVSNGKTVSIQEMLKSPDDYKDYEVSFTGVVSEYEGESGDYGLYLYTNIADSDGDVFVYTTSEEEIEDGDFVKVDGVVVGTLEGENTFGTEVEDPAINAVSVTKISGDDAVAPTTLSKEPGDVKQIGDLTITLTKIEYAENETRVYLSFDNRSSRDYEFYDYDTVLTQGKKDIGMVDDYERNTNQNETEVEARGKLDAKIYFEGTNPDKPTTLKVEVTETDDYTTESVEFKF